MDEVAEKRKRTLTPKMAAYMDEESCKRLALLTKTYEQWKITVKECKTRLKEECTDQELGEMIDSIQVNEGNVIQCFERLKYSATPDADIVRRVDACVSVTNEAVRMINEMISGVETYNDTQFKNQLKGNGYASSIFTLSDIDAESERSGQTIKSAASEQAIKATMELADKRAELAALEVEREYNNVENSELSNQKIINARKNIAAAEARLATYTQVANESNNQATDNNNNYEHSKASTKEHSVSDLAKAFADSVNLNRLPVPEPSVFSGDPLQFIEWRTSFKLLIESKGITPSDKIFYLKRYVSGEAKRSIEGYFFGGSVKAYDNAMAVLEERFGHPFIVQRAFRSKLDNWPNIPARNPRLLRDFGDFLRSCKDANDQFSNLSVLSDCVENRKMVKKLPEWLAIKWNRQVQASLDSDSVYPCFEQFVDFVNKEARIACNPMSSPYFLEGKSIDKRNANSLTTNVTEDSSDKTKYKVCAYCKRKGHLIEDCRNFGYLTIEQKRTYVKDNKLCYGCLHEGHTNRNCPAKLTCTKCNLRHPSCMHENRGETKCNDVVKSASAFRVNRNEGQGTSMIVPVWLSLESAPDREILTYALLDTQSDTSFIHEDAATGLNAHGVPTKLSLSTMSSEKTIVQSKGIKGLMVRGFHSNERLKINYAYTSNFIPVDRSHIPTRETALSWPHLKDIADNVAPLQSCDVGLLLGYNCPQALAPLQTIQGTETQPYAVLTKLGWSIVGYNNCDSNFLQIATCHRVITKELPLISPRDAVKVFESDFVHDAVNDVKVSQDDITFLKIMENNVYQRNDKHLELPLPFKERPVLPDNRSLALTRLSHLKRKLGRDQVYHEKYKQYMNELIERGDAEIVPEQSSSVSQWYIPHHGIFHPKKPDKLRVVFDCSAKFKGTTLNQHLLSGPDLTNGLTGVIIRFRRFPVAIMCDIEKMFHQFFVHEPDRDYLRFVWWKDGDLNAEPLDYRMRKHLFGAASSPACANYGLKYLAECKSNVYPEAAAFVQNDFYVDDGLASVKYECEAVELVKDAQTICNSGGLRLHKFVSNSRSVIETIPPSERAEDVKNLNLTCESLPVERALGILWNIEQDMFQFHAKQSLPSESEQENNKILCDMNPTRRNILSVVASIFDPLGFLSPVTLSGKKLLQHMCQHGIGWDDQLSVTDKPEWNNWLKNLSELDNVQIPRCLIPVEFCSNTGIELHHFSDASSYAYGQCSYIRLVKEDSVHCALLIGKARVAPLTVVTIPRLELTAALLSVKMSLFLKRELHLPVSKEYFWTDSRVVLGYIANEARRFHVFVANRVQMIRQSTEPSQWFYVQSKDNPADHASRGLSASALLDSSWFTGPTFLWKRHIDFETVTPQLQLGDPEVKAVRTLLTETSDNINLLSRLERFSCWLRVVTIVARLQRLANGVKGTHSPDVEERRHAELAIIKLIQGNAFSDTIDILSSSTSLPKTNSLYPLNPVLKDGVLCVGTRLLNAKLSDVCIFPVILPKDSYMTQLIVSHAHQSIQHQGRGFTLNKLRCLGYWVVGGSKMVANFIRKCVVCRKLRRPTECQKMAELPADRVETYPPFTYCGMDCFGPFPVKNGRKEIKRYGLLFTCLCSRAVHIEMLDDMSTDAFINSLRCFMAIRGAVRQIRSDQGSNFIGAKNELSVKLEEPKVVSYLAEKHCDFLFNAPSSSHTGGVWERQIRTIRSVLNSVMLLCPGRLDDSSLRTLFYEVMAIINCRPLTVFDINDPSALEPLTPNHILTAKSDIPAPPPGEFVREDLFLRKRWRRVQYLLEQFWSRWQREYLAAISLRQKWHTAQRNIRVGDIVLIKDEGLPRNHWSLAVVVEANPDGDGLVRRVKVKLGIRGSTPITILERSVHKLVLLIQDNSV
ncbi:hypothetical protein ACF0H5_022735 [Mactra antiquata]